MPPSNPNRNKVQVNIIGDDTELDESLKDSETLINAFGKRVVSSLQQVTYVAAELKDQLVTTFLKGADALASFTLKIKDSTLSLDGFTNAWSRTQMYFETLGLEIQELILHNRSLAKTIELTGKSAGYSAQSLQEYADYLEKTTRYTAETTKSAMQLIAHFRNIHGEQFLAATKSAQDLATELRTDLNSAAQLVAESLNDPITALERLNAVNIFFTKSEENAIKSAMRLNKVAEAQDLILNKLVKSFGGAAKEAGETFAGKLERLQNVMHSIGTRIGESVYNKINAISEVLFKNKNVFDALIDKISQWGEVAIKIVDDVTRKIANFVVQNKTKFIEIFDWLVDKTLKVAVTIPQVFSRAAEILSTLNTFIFDSFVKTWENISKIFTDILPASYKYMKDVFGNVISTISTNAYIFWHNFREFAETALHNIWIEFLKLKTRVGGWFKALRQIIDEFASGNISGKTLVDVIEAAITGDTSKLESKWRALQHPIEAAALLRIKAAADDAKATEKQVGALESYKKEWKGLSDLLQNLNIENPFDNTILPSIKGSLSLTKEWGELMKGISSTMNKDFDNVDERVKSIRAYFDKFVKEVNEQAKNAGGIKEPKLQTEKDRRADEKKQGGFANKVVSGLEEFWYKGQSEEAKNTKAIEENTKTLKEQREDRKKLAEEMRADRQNKTKQERLDYLKNTGRIKSEEERTQQEKVRREQQDKMQRRIYGINKTDLDRLEALQKKDKQFRASGKVLTPDENREIKDLEARKRSREIYLRNTKNEELRENERERLRNIARLNRIENRRKEMENRQNTGVRTERTAQGQKSEKSEMTKDNMKVAVKDGNKDAVSELQIIAKNTEKLSKFFEQVAIV